MGMRIPAFNSLVEHSSTVFNPERIEESAKMGAKMLGINPEKIVKVTYDRKGWVRIFGALAKDARNGKELTQGTDELARRIPLADGRFRLVKTVNDPVTGKPSFDYFI